MMKKLVSLALAFLMLMSVSSVVYADETNFLMETTTYTSHIAYLENINAQGTNLHDETVDGSSKTIPNTNASIAILADNTLTVTTNVDGTPVVFSGVPAGRTESGKSVFFTGASSNSDYEVVDFTYVSDTSVTNMYFKTTKDTNYADSDTILKLYVKDLSSATRDYYFIEVFDVELNYSNEYIQSLEINPLLGSWVTTQFQPIDENFGINESVVMPISTPDTKYWYCEKFYHGGEFQQVHRIEWITVVDPTHIPIGSESMQYYALKVNGKSIACEENKDLESSSQSCLDIVHLTLKQTSGPNTAWKKVDVDGDVVQVSGFGSPSIYLGVAWGFWE